MRVVIVFLLGFLSGTLRSGAQVPAVQSAVAQVNLDSLTHFVRQLSGEAPVVIGGVQDTIRSRHYQHPGNEKAFRFLRAKMQSYGLSVDSVMVGPRKSLIATLPGVNAAAYSVGAHYDCVGDAFTPFAGADDDGSGCAAVIELARILSAMPVMPYSVRFAFWDEEELGALGSHDYAPTLNPQFHRGYINLDMIGYDGNGDSLIELYTAPRGASQAFANVAEAARQTYGIGLQIERIDPGPFNTDYVAFWNLNYTAIGLAEDLAGDRNPKYHQLGDSLALFDLPYFRKLTQLALATLAHSAITDPLGIAAGPAPTAPFAVWTHVDNGRTALRFRTPADGDFSFLLVDAAGRVVQRRTLTVAAGTHTLVLDEAGMLAGLYVCVAEARQTNAAPLRQQVKVMLLP